MTTSGNVIDSDDNVMACILSMVFSMSRAGATLPNVRSFIDLYELLHAHVSYPSPFW